jgi:hypothetical protein
MGKWISATGGAVRDSMCNKLSSDPSSCPLLAGLSPQERRDRIKKDPLIRACLAALGQSSVGGCASNEPADRRGRAKRKAAPELFLV